MVRKLRNEILGMIQERKFTTWSQIEEYIRDYYSTGIETAWHINQAATTGVQVLKRDNEIVMALEQVNRYRTM